MHRQTGFERDLVPGRINFEIPIQAKITEHRDAQLAIPLGNSLEARSSHVALVGGSGSVLTFFEFCVGQKVRTAVQLLQQMVQKRHIVALYIFHLAAHP